jgi:hypothetical protein
MGVLYFAWHQREIHDMPIAFTWFMIFLSFPCGFLVAVVAAIMTTQISELFALPYNPFLSHLPGWLMFTVVGYLQWFVLLPFLWKKIVASRAAG